ncbi:hypothetical protein Dimus_010942 [Dionaea muscipula]
MTSASIKGNSCILADLLLFPINPQHLQDIIDSMGLILSHSSLLLAFVVTFVVTIQIFLCRRRHRSPFSSPKLPPGTVGWPLVGETLQFLSAGWKGHPESFVLNRMSKFSSECFKTSIIGVPTAFACGAAGNKFLFSNEGKLVSVWWPDSVKKLFPTTGDQIESAKRMRRLLPQFFKPEALQGYIGNMDDIAQRHFASHWDNHPQVTVFPLAKRYTFWVACQLFLSMEDPKHIELLVEPFEHISSGVIGIPVDLPGTQFNRAIKASKMVREKLGAITKQRKHDLAKNNVHPEARDILSHMLVSIDEDGQHMDELEIVDKIMGLLIGGHDTASSTITILVKFLAEYPQVYVLVYKEQMEIARSKAPGELLNWYDIQQMKYSWNVACEVLRLFPPLQVGFREAIHDLTYSSFQVPKGWKLCWSAHSTHYDPNCFSEPQKFDPTRFEGKGPAPYTYIPFGGGPRMCPGKEYARLEILVFMHNIVKRFRWEKLLPEEKITFNPLPSPVSGLPIRLTPHDKYHSNI